MKILKSDFYGLAGFLIDQLGLANKSIYADKDYYYFRFDDLLKMDQYNWKEIAIDIQNALIHMGMVFKDGIPTGETEVGRAEAKAVKEAYLRQHAKERNEILKEAAIKKAKKIEKWGKNEYLNYVHTLSYKMKNYIKPEDKNVSVMRVFLTPDVQPINTSYSKPLAISDQFLEAPKNKILHQFPSASQTKEMPKKKIKCTLKKMGTVLAPPSPTTLLSTTSPIKAG